MASRVNTKFVLILSAVLVGMTLAAVGVALYAINTRGQKLVNDGDEYMAKNQYVEAESAYGRAVNKDRTNLEWLLKWQNALLHLTPENRPQYEKLYNNYFSSLAVVAQIKSSDPEAQIAYIEEYDRRVRAGGGGSRAGMEVIIKEVTTLSQRLDEDDPGAKKLLRYRGLAQTDRMSMLTVTEEERTQALSDLRTALEADPDDVEVALGIVRWHLAELTRVRDTENRPDLVPDVTKGLDEALAAALEKFPDDPRVLRLDLGIAMERAARSGANPEQVNRLVAQLQDKARGVVAAAKSADPAILEPGSIEGLRRILPRVLGASVAPDLREIMNRRLAGSEFDAEALLVSGQIYVDEGEHDRALEELQKVIDHPDLPISLDGLMLQQHRDLALAFQIDALISKWTVSQGAEREEALARAKSLVDQLRTAVGALGKEIVLLREAKVAMAEERFDIAVQNLYDLQLAIGFSEEVSSLLAEALRRQDNPGESARILEELIDKAGERPVYMERLGQVYVALSNLPAAREIYRKLVAQDPDNAAYTERLLAIQTAMGEVKGSEQVDPIVQALLDAQKLVGEGEFGAARGLLEPLLVRNPEDWRLIRQLVQIDLIEGNRETALARINEALKIAPDSERLLSLKTQIEVNDPVEAQLRILDQSDASTVEKMIARYQVLAAAGRAEEATNVLKEAERSEPDHPMVIEATFLDAIGHRDIERARRIARRAAELNSDQIRGLLFQGRLELWENKPRDAVATLEKAVQANPYLPGAWRLLGDAQMRVGRVGDATKSLERAMQQRPNDRETAKIYARALVTQNQTLKALEVVRPMVSSALSAGDNDYRELWLNLEASVGDRERALTMRRELYSRVPNDAANTAALINLYLAESKFDEASAMITTLEQGGAVEPLAIAAYRARVASRTQSVEKTAEIFTNHIATLSENEDKLRAYVTLGEFMLELNSKDRALAAFEQARDFQDPKLRQADRRLGDYHFQEASSIQTAESIGLTTELPDDHPFKQHLTSAAERYSAVLAAGVDDKEVLEAVEKRYAETLIKLRRLDDASRILTRLSTSSPDDLQVLILTANMKALQGDRRGARQTLDRAVELFPSDPMPFLQRALLNQEDPTLFNDVMADLQRVVRLRPAFIDAWLMRYELYRSRASKEVDKERAKSDEEAAIAELRKGLEANPSSDALRLTLVRYLKDRGRMDEMLAAVRTAAQDRQDDVRWLFAAAREMSLAGRHREAAELYQLVYAREELPEIAALLLDNWLRSDSKPPRPEVNRLVAKIEPDSAGKIDWMMIVARARLFLGDQAAGNELIGRALALCGDDSAMSLLWLNQLNAAMETREATFKYLDNLMTAAQRNPNLTMPKYIASVYLSEKAARGAPGDEILAQIAELSRQTEDRFVLLSLNRTASVVLYRSERYSEAIEAMRAGVAIAPNDLELNNNLAYTLAAHLEDHEAALPYAQKAVELDPLSSNALDTLGWVYFKLGRFQDARASLERAERNAQRPEERLIALTHLGLTETRLDDPESARRRLADVESMISKNPALAQAYPNDVEALREALN